MSANSDCLEPSPVPSPNAADELETDPTRPLHLSHNGESAETSTQVAIRSPILIQPVWTDALVDDIDSRYFHFFLMHATNALLYTELFPRAIYEIFTRSIHNKTLQYSVLAVSSIAVDASLHRPLTRALTHKQNALTLLQQSLSNGNITEEVAISIFLLLYMDCFSGKEVSQGHLKGLYLVLKHIKFDLGNPLVLKNVSPLLMLIWRVSLSLDLMTSAVQRTPPILPAFPTNSTAFNRTWATCLSNDVKNVDFALASFWLDDLFHRSRHWLHECTVTMLSCEYTDNPHNKAAYDAIVESRIGLLRQEHANWAQQPICVLGMQLEKSAQIWIGDAPNLPRFLNYPPLLIYDHRFSILLNRWRLMSLLIAFFPLSALPQHTISEMDNAIEICRTHAALGLSPTSKDYVTEFFAVLGAARMFAGGRKYKDEFRWTFEKIAEMDGMHHFILTEFQDYIDSIKDFKLFDFPEWDISEDILAETGDVQRGGSK
jgi:hypothetical protein